MFLNVTLYGKCLYQFQCNNCGQLVIHPEQRFNFFSDYSQMVSCPHCGVQVRETLLIPQIY